MNHRDQFKALIQRSQELANQRMKQSDVIARRREEMESNSEYQRKKRIGADARMREGVDILTKRIYERDHHGEALPSYSAARAKAEETAERVAQRLKDKK
jgi:hypothetical protein